MLYIENLWARIKDNKSIIKGFHLKVGAGEIHAIMGPNGAGKSTLAKVIAGHPDYEIEEGEITLDGASLNTLSPEERSHLGLFTSFQYPLEIPGVPNQLFLKHAYNSHLKAQGKEVIDDRSFEVYLQEKLKQVEMKPEFATRGVNEGFSGGEKKRNEILQLALLNPKVAILDETDSGLDIDAIRTVAQGVKDWMGPDKCLILITHYQRLLDYIKPDFVHVMIDGHIAQTGDFNLAFELEKQGYDRLLQKT